MPITQIDYEAIFRDATDPIIVEDLNGYVIDLNPIAQLTYGWKREELIGKPIKQIVPNEFHNQADELLRQCVGGEQVRNVEGERIARDGRRIPVLLTMSLLRSGSGKAFAVASFTKDLDRLRQMQESLHRLASVFQNSSDPIIIEDLRGIVKDVNQAAVNSYGWSRHEMIGESIKLVMPQHCHDQADELLARCIAGETIRNIDGWRQTKSGDSIPVLFSLSLLDDRSGNAKRVASFAKDTTALKRAESQLKEWNTDLEKRIARRTTELNQANEQLVHELAVARELSHDAARKSEYILEGESIAVRALRDSIDRATESETVMLIGPQGAGQEATARAIHAGSRSRFGPFIMVDCSHAGPANESLFCTRVTDSGEALPSKAMLAKNGTLYLESVERLDKIAQHNLLETLQANELDLRVVSHPKSDLLPLIQEGAFDPELYKLLGNYRMTVPALSDRKSDILILAEQIVSRYSRKLGKAIEGIGERSKQLLLEYSWPGNWREFRNVLERAVLLATGSIVDVPEELLSEGRRIGSYTMIRRLGAGGMGDVWLAKHSLLARLAAIKLIREPNADSPEEQLNLETRFKREAKETSRLRSPHTIELYDFGVTEESDFYYVMEFLDGIDLERFFTQFGKTSLDRSLSILMQACLSLSEAHGMGLIHRDIKPSNIFLCRLGSQLDFVKVLDFGMVRNTVVDQSMTMTGQMTGTPLCMAPEIIASLDATTAADVYSLGCVAYRLVSGQQVFNTENVMTLLLHHSTKQPASMHTIDQSIPHELDQLVLQCLEKEPQDRPTAMEFYERLQSIAQALPGRLTTAEISQWWSEHLPEIKV